MPTRQSTNVNDLIQFIENIDDEYRSVDDWERELNENVPEWRKIVRLKKNWQKIEDVRPKNKKALSNYDNLCDTILNEVGLELAARWFKSNISEQKDAAKDWFERRINRSEIFNYSQEIREFLIVSNPLTAIKYIDVDIWNELSEGVKNVLIDGIFDIDNENAEPFRTIDRLIADIRWEYRYMLDKLERVKNIFFIKDISHQLLMRYFMPDIPITSYIPINEVNILRNIVEEAGDKKYLRLIDNMMEIRQKACKDIRLFNTQNSTSQPYQLNDIEKELIARVFEITSRNGYRYSTLPTIELSFETPPLFVAYPELEDELYEKRYEFDEYEREDEIFRNRDRRRPEFIDVDEVLGLYKPYEKKIVLFARGIEWHSKKYGTDPKWLYAVVLIHELGHWITHALPKDGVPMWDTDLFAMSETDLLEGWAQLITYWIAQNVGGEFKRVFDSLNRHHPLMML